MASLIKGTQSRIILLVVVVILGSCLGNVSQTALNAMFSGMAADFGVDAALGQWVTTLYMLVLGITVLAVTYLMRRFPLKSVTMGALLLMLVGSIIDATALNFPMLIVGRVLQAVSAGITMPMMISIIMTSFPKDRQATIMGIAGIAMGFAPNIGPTIGGWMLELAGWRSFFVALTICSLALIVAALALLVPQPRSRESENAHLDMLSLVLSALGFGGLLLGFSNASSYGLASLFVWVPVVAGAVFLVLFLRRQRRIEYPLINLDIFASKRYRTGFWATNFLFASFMGITLVIPLYVEGLWGGTAVQAGLALLPGTVAAFIFNPLSGYLTDRIGVRPVVLVASTCLVVGAVSMAFLDENSPFWLIVALQGVRAAGVSGLISPLTSWSMTELPKSIMTDGSSFSTAARQASASLGTALMVFAITLGSALGGEALGYHLAFACSALFAILMGLMALFRVR